MEGLEAAAVGEGGGTSGGLNDGLYGEEEVLDGDADGGEGVVGDVDDVVLFEEDVGGGVALFDDFLEVDDGDVALVRVSGGLDDVDAFGPAEVGGLGFGEGADEGVPAGRHRSAL